MQSAEQPRFERLSKFARELGVSEHVAKAAMQRGEIPVRFVELGDQRKITFVHSGDVARWRAQYAAPIAEVER
jgi:hypothetical protein